MSKGGKRRQKIIMQDVEAYVRYAFYSGDHSNPYPADDKRHALFYKQLGHTLSIDADFREMNAFHGGDNEALGKRAWPNPGPVRPIDELIAQAAREEEVARQADSHDDPNPRYFVSHSNAGPYGWEIGYLLTRTRLCGEMTEEGARQVMAALQAAREIKSLRPLRDNWEMVTAQLDTAMPGWQDGGQVGGEAAATAIRRLSVAAQQDSYGHVLEEARLKVIATLTQYLETNKLDGPLNPKYSQDWIDGFNEALDASLSPLIHRISDVFEAVAQQDKIGA